MSVLGWILSAVLAVILLGAGITKLTSSREKLLANPNMAWVNDFSAQQVKAIAAVEVLGALGVVLPWLLNIARVLTPIAAVGSALVMLGAIIVHLRRHEAKALPPASVAFVLAVAVAIIRFSQL